MPEIIPIGLYGNMTVTYPAFLGESLNQTTQITLRDAQIGIVDLADITDISVAKGVPSPQGALVEVHPEGGYDGAHAVQRAAGSLAVVQMVLSERNKFETFNWHWNMGELGWFTVEEFEGLTDDGQSVPILTSALPTDQKLSRVIPFPNANLPHLTDIDDARRRARAVGEAAGYRAA